MEFLESWKGKRILVTGAAGTVGQEICARLAGFGQCEITGIDNNESEIFYLDQLYRDNPAFDFFLCDIRDKDALISHMRGFHIVLHCAALKHVSICEKSPRAALAANITGVQNMIDAAFACNIEKLLFTSSDKAVNPFNVMGTSKLMGERLITAAELAREYGDPHFSVTRFGNVLGSRGSVIPLFKKQIGLGGPVTLTDRRMTRFIMTLEESVELVLQSAVMSEGGEVFITKMPAIRISDLAEVMVEHLAPGQGYVTDKIEITEIGARTGEKIYEELMNEEECRRSYESDRFFIISPAMNMSMDPGRYKNLGLKPAEMPYNSSNVDLLTPQELSLYLIRNRLLEESGLTQKTKPALRSVV